jgi:hypothetical protein
MYVARNSPVRTRVAEWSKLDTGVGPSMASGNHRNEYTVMDLTEAMAISKIGVKDNNGIEHMGRTTVRSNKSENRFEERAITEPRAAEERYR